MAQDEEAIDVASALAFPASEGYFTDMRQGICVEGQSQGTVPESQGEVLLTFRNPPVENDKHGQDRPGTRVPLETVIG